MQDVEGEVASPFGPFVVLLGEDGPDQARHGVAVGEDPDDVGAPADLLVQPLVGVVRPAWRRSLLRGVVRWLDLPELNDTTLIDAVEREIVDALVKGHGVRASIDGHFDR